ncbi:MAG TPA: hypothetical protein VG841_12235 [Caulobacterales bacterium]|nr:hypothetical protein [Caulobacterales bacterium]
MRPMYLLAAVALWGIAQTAAAAPVSVAPVAVAPELQTKITEDLGQRDGDYLLRETTDEVTEALAGAGAEIKQDAPVRVEITLIDAKPNHPTFAQLGRAPFLDISSVSIGGAQLHAVLRGANGAVISEVDYRYYDPQIDAFTQAASTWSTARRAIRTFAQRVASAYRTNAASS